jgi:glycerophosphoryl diester phosphodiesterase
MAYTPKMEAPENTLSSVRRTKEPVCTWVEVDVMLTKDKDPVIHHDNTFERCTNDRVISFFNSAAVRP